MKPMVTISIFLFIFTTSCFGVLVQIPDAQSLGHTFASWDSGNPKKVIGDIIHHLAGEKIEIGAFYILTTSIVDKYSLGKHNRDLIISSILKSNKEALKELANRTEFKILL